MALECWTTAPDYVPARLHANATVACDLHLNLYTVPSRVDQLLRPDSALAWSFLSSGGQGQLSSLRLSSGVHGQAWDDAHDQGGCCP